jgi:two-component system cell cycle sensor histidine kinase/response regulator CckA
LVATNLPPGGDNMENDFDSKPHLPNQLFEDSTQSIDLSQVFTRELTSSGSFDIRGEIWKTTFGKVMQSLPIPALLIDRSQRIVVMNQGCGRISPEYEKVSLRSFSSLFPDSSIAKKSESLVEEVFSTRMPRVVQSTLQMESSQIYGRLTFRSIRIMRERFLLVLVEDLTSERREILLKQQHAEQLMEEIRLREQAEKELADSEKRYRELIERASDIVYQADANGLFTLVNPSVERLTGYAAEEIIGKHYLELVSREHKIDTERFYEIQVAKRLPITYQEIPIVTKKGETVWLGQNIQLLMEGETVAGFQAIARDITERKRAEEDLRRSKETIEALLNASTDVAVLLDSEGKILAANEQAVRRLGKAIEELLGESVFDFSPPQISEPRRRRLRRVVRTGKPLRVEDMGYEDKIYDTSAYPVFGSGGGVEAVAVFARDITQHKRLQEQLRQASKMEAVGTLAGGMAHDFNNLLQVILGYADLLLLDKDPTHPDYGRVKAVRESARKGRDLVQRILTFSRKVEFSPRPIDLNHEVRKAQELLYRTVPKMIEIKLNLAERLKTINGDPDQIEQVLVNLAVNARDAMPEGGRLSFETRNVSLDEHFCTDHPEVRPGDYVLLQVSDTGLGMEKDVLDRIFEPFYTTKDTGEGTGLGLAMVYGIVKGHGGHIACSSQLGAGTTFQIYFPTVEEDVQADSETTMEMPPFGTETLLLVDDDESVIEVGTEMLSRAGYQILTASSGQEAVEIFRTSKEKIALIILDLIMPEMGGRRCLEELLAIDPEVRVLIATGYYANGPKQEIIDAGARGFIRKPFETKQILVEIRKILDES